MSATASSERVFRPTIGAQRQPLAGHRGRPNTTGSAPAAWATARPQRRLHAKHITHGRAITVHASQGTTAPPPALWLGDSSRAALYVAMTPAREVEHRLPMRANGGRRRAVDRGWDLWVKWKAEAMVTRKSTHASSVSELSAIIGGSLFLLVRAEHCTSCAIPW